MSQIASFTYLPVSDVPLLGFWSKPKPRLFRRPESKFSEYLDKHSLRECTYAEADGCYIVAALEWNRMQLDLREMESPLIGTLQKHLGGSHWIFEFNENNNRPFVTYPPSQEQWSCFLDTIGFETFGLDRVTFNSAHKFLNERLSNIGNNEALLISVG